MLVMQKEEKKRKSKLSFGIRAVLFAAVAFVMLAYVTYVLTPKKDYGICSMVNFYNQPKQSIDVLAIGTSLLYAGNNTNVLWTEYGIASYNLCSAEQPYWVSYYILKEALKTQSPKVVLLDAKPSIYTRDYSKRGRTIMSTYGIRGLENRFGAMFACVEDPMDAIGYVLALPQVHSNYETLTTQDLVYPPDNGGRGSDWKGYIENDETEKHSKPSLVYNNVKRNMNDREEEYARKIFQLCQENGIELMLVGVPNPDYASDHMYYNTLWEIAEEYGISGINYNDPDLRFGLRYTTDFADWQHLNVKGSVTFSRKLAQDLKERYELEDRRGMEGYESYDRCADSWYQKYPEYLPGEETATEDV